MSYGLLLSHTFPGLLLEVEVIIAFRFFTKLDMPLYSMLFGGVTENYSMLRAAATLAGMFIVATLLGIVIDGIHHWIYEGLWRKEADYEIYKYIRNTQQMQIYIHFVEDDLWYYYEAYANTGIAMIPGFFLTGYWLIWLLQPHWLFTFTALAIYIFLLIVTFIEVIHTKQEVEEVEKSLVENFKNKSISPDSGG